MTLGFHYHVPMLTKNNEIYTIGLQGVFLDSLSIYFDEIICFMNSAKYDEEKKMDYKIQSNNIKFIDIGIHNHMFKRVLVSNSVKNIFLQSIDKVDSMLIRGPSPYLPLFSKCCKKHKIPYSYLLVADYLEVLKSSKSKLYKKIPLWLYFRYNKFLQDYYGKSSNLIANSRVIVDEYKNKNYKYVNEVKTTTLKNSDIFEKNKIIDLANINILFTGRIESQKGIHDILSAMQILKRKEINITLNLVGWETENGYLKYLLDLSEEYNLSDKFIFHGSKKVGEELLSYYRNNDVFVIASTGNFEGFPRSIWEAMASSTPVVASAVSSIPYFLTDEKNVLLFNPNDANKLAELLETLIKNPDIKDNIVNNALNFVKEVTLEKQSKILAELILEYNKEINE